MLEPIIASQPCEERNQNANGDEEAKRDHPYPQPVAFVLFPQPRLAGLNVSTYIVAPSAVQRVRRGGGGRTCV